MSRHKLTVRDLEDSWACKHAQEALSSDKRVAEIRTLLDEVRAEAWDEGWNAGASWPQDDTNPYRKQEEA